MKKCEIYGGYANCSKCQTLVNVVDIPTKSDGRCWRCEVAKLRKEIAELRGATQIGGN